MITSLKSPYPSVTGAGLLLNNALLLFIGVDGTGGTEEVIQLYPSCAGPTYPAIGKNGSSSSPNTRLCVPYSFGMILLGSLGEGGDGSGERWGEGLFFGGVTAPGMRMGLVIGT
jgi:hypothetical protein